MNSITKTIERIICFFRGHKYISEHWACVRCGLVKDCKCNEWTDRVLQNISKVFDSRPKGKYCGEKRKDIVSK